MQVALPIPWVRIISQRFSIVLYVADLGPQEVSWGTISWVSINLLMMKPTLEPKLRPELEPTLKFALKPQIETTLKPVVEPML